MHGSAANSAAAKEGYMSSVCLFSSATVYMAADEFGSTMDVQAQFTHMVLLRCAIEH
jgi:hypothetical protein